MTMTSTGYISLGGGSPTFVVGSGGTQKHTSIQYELYAVNTVTYSLAGTRQISLNDSDARTLASRPSGAISFSDFYNKSSFVSTTTYFQTPGIYTYIVPFNYNSLTIEVWGGGGAGGEAGTIGSGANGSTSIVTGTGITSIVANGGQGGSGFITNPAYNNNTSPGGTGGTASGGSVNVNGNSGSSGFIFYVPSGLGGTPVPSGAFGGQGGTGTNGLSLQGGIEGIPGFVANNSNVFPGGNGGIPGAGGAGAYRSGGGPQGQDTYNAAGGGGAGGYARSVISTLNYFAVLNITVGQGGVKNAVGGDGGDGTIVITVT